MLDSTVWGAVELRSSESIREELSMLIPCRCGKKLRVADERAGERVKCPACGAWTVAATGLAVAPPAGPATPVVRSASNTIVRDSAQEPSRPGYVTIPASLTPSALESGEDGPERWFYDEDTPWELITILESARRKQTRLRLHYDRGPEDPKFRSWMEEQSRGSGVPLDEPLRFATGYLYFAHRRFWLSKTPRAKVHGLDLGMIGPLHFLIKVETVDPRDGGVLWEAGPSDDNFGN